MSRNDKLLAKVEGHRHGSLPHDLFHRYLDLHGWVLVRQQGSHMIYRDQAGRPVKPIPLVNGREVRASYVREIVKKIREERDGSD